MTIEFNCPHCAKVLRTADEKAGLKAKCPGCKQPVRVPAQSAIPAADEYDFGAADGGYEDYDAGGEDDYGSPALPPMVGGTKQCPMCGGTVKAAAVKCRHCGEDLGGMPAASRGRGRTRDYAGFWLRFGAYFIDSILLNIVNFIITFVISVIFLGLAQAGGGPPNEGVLVLLQFVTMGISVVIVWLYFAFMESSSNQATLGKMAVGIKVTDLDGRSIGFGKATGRFFGKILSGMICMAGYIMAGFTEQKQALHDMLAGTLVVRK